MGVVRFPSERRSGIPGIIGAIDGPHIRVQTKRSESQAYFNYKKYYTFLLSAVVDPRGLFMCADVGFPGRFHDAAASRQSRLWQHHRSLFSSHKVGASGDYSCIYGDGAYLLHDRILAYWFPQQIQVKVR